MLKLTSPEQRFSLTSPSSHPHSRANRKLERAAEATGCKTPRNRLLRTTSRRNRATSSGIRDAGAVSNEEGGTRGGSLNT